MPCLHVVARNEIRRLARAPLMSSRCAIVVRAGVLSRERVPFFRSYGFIIYPVGNPTPNSPHLYSASIEPSRGACELGREKERAEEGG